MELLGGARGWACGFRVFVSSSAAGDNWTSSEGPEMVFLEALETPVGHEAWKVWRKL